MSWKADVPGQFTLFEHQFSQVLFLCVYVSISNKWKDRKNKWLSNEKPEIEPP